MLQITTYVTTCQSGHVHLHHAAIENESLPLCSVAAVRNAIDALVECGYAVDSNERQVAINFARAAGLPEEISEGDKLIVAFLAASEAAKNFFSDRGGDSADDDTPHDGCGGASWPVPAAPGKN